MCAPANYWEPTVSLLIPDVLKLCSSVREQKSDGLSQLQGETA